MSENFDSRSELLLKDKFDQIKNFKITIFGLGGVGSIIPLVLVRSGFKNFNLIDGDIVTISNLNRQIAYDEMDLNTPKVEAIKKKILDIRKDVTINPYKIKIHKGDDLNIFKDSDYIIDAIDDLEAKTYLIKFCYLNNIKIISCLGTGNKLDPTKVEITKLNKTTIDPLARKLRYMLKKENVDVSQIIVAFSKEEPIIKNNIVSSMAFVPNAAGLAISSFVLRDLLDIKE